MVCCLHSGKFNAVCSGCCGKFGSIELELQLCVSVWCAFGAPICAALQFNITRVGAPSVAVIATVEAIV